MLLSALHHFVLVICAFAMYTHAQIPIRLLTHNIRFATTTPGKGEKPWTDRRQLLLNELYVNTLYNPESFICLQEVLNNQIVDIMNGLNATTPGEWAYIGVGRDDGKTKGEYSPVIYRPGVWKLEWWKTVWMSETPDVPSKGWDAASIRIVTVGVFTHRTSGKTIVGMSTHFDDQGEVSRTNSAKLILKVISDVTTANSTSPLPVFLGGDLNSEQTGSAYQILTSSDSTLQDVKGMAPVKYGDLNTFTGFPQTAGNKGSAVIDYVFVGPRKSRVWGGRAYTVLENRFEDGVFNSDHRGVVGDTVLVI